MGNTKTAEKSGTLHFTIGERFGIQLKEIADEHLFCTRDLQKAWDTYSKSLIGASDEHIKSLLKGEAVLTVNVKEQALGMVDLESNDRIFQFIRLEYHRLTAETTSMRVVVNHASELVSRMGYMNYGTDISLDEAQEIYSKGKKMYDILNRISDDFSKEVQADHRIEQVTSSIKLVSDHAKDLLRMAIFTKAAKNLGLFGDDEARYNLYYGGFFNIGSMFHSNYLRLSNGDTIQDESMDMLDAHLKAQTEIDKIISKPIEPYDYVKSPIVRAYWVSPEGVVYGLDGEISNMLHYTLASAIVNKTDVNLNSINENEDNDAYQELESAGWMKITGNWALFDGDHCKVTKAQQKVLGDIAELMFMNDRSIMRIGYCDKQVLPTRIKMMDLIMLQKHFTL